MQTPLNKVTEKYSDLRNSFEVHPIKKDILLNKDENAVKNSIKNLMFTGPYERRFRPALGAGLTKYLFEPISSVTGALIRTSIIRTIQNYEKRAILLDVNVQVNPDYNSYTASITFRIINKIEPITFSAILERVR